MSGAPIDVAVGVLIRTDGSFLIAQRPAGKPMAGYWEFPGGKVEPGESVFHALQREFVEELGVRILSGCPWAQRVFVYPHATVRLHFWRVYEWSGEPQSLEGQAWCWERLDKPRVEPWLPGALPLKRWLALPDFYAISNVAEWGIAGFLQRLDARLSGGALAMLLLREPTLTDAQFAPLFEAVLTRMRTAGARLLVSSRHAGYAARADGVHLTARDLQATTTRPEVDWCAASCHDAADLERAGQLALDFAVLGPVLPTASHPGGGTLGWPGFMAASHETTLPVYALGGLDVADLAQARSVGAQGVALLRAAWTLPVSGA